MPKKGDRSEFTKASIKKDSKEVLKKAADREHLYEYELLEKLLREHYSELYSDKKTE